MSEIYVLHQYLNPCPASLMLGMHLSCLAVILVPFGATFLYLHPPLPFLLAQYATPTFHMVKVNYILSPSYILSLFSIRFRITLK